MRVRLSTLSCVSFIAILDLEERVGQRLIRELTQLLDKHSASLVQFLPIRQDTERETMKMIFLLLNRFKRSVLRWRCR